MQHYFHLSCLNNYLFIYFIYLFIYTIRIYNLKKKNVHTELPHFVIPLGITIYIRSCDETPKIWSLLKTLVALALRLYDRLKN